MLEHVPRARTNDLVYINPADIERPIGFNPLSRVPHDLKPIVADGVVSAFRHVWPESWGPRLDYILTNAVRALLDVPGATLLMLPRLLIDEAFRVQLVEHHVGDPVVRAFWLNEYAGYGDSFRAEAIAPIQNKIGKALMVPRLRNMLAQPKSTITLAPADGRGRDRHLQSGQGRASAKAPRICSAPCSPRRSPRPRCRAPTFRPGSGERFISTPTNSNRSPPKALRSSCPRPANTP